MQLADHIRVGAALQSGKRLVCSEANVCCCSAVYPERPELYGGGGGASAGILARRSGEGGASCAVEGPGDVLQRHKAVLQEDSPQDARNRRSRHSGGAQLWAAGDHGDESLSASRKPC